MNLSSSQIRKCARNLLSTCVQLDKVTAYIIEHHLWNVHDETSCNILMSTLSEFPKQINQFTPKLFSSMLSTYYNSLVQVLSFQFERIGQGKGWSGRLYRLYDIRYEDSLAIDLPTSLVLKLSSGIWM